MGDRNIEARRLDVVLAQAKEQAAEPATLALIEEFETVLRARRRRGSLFGSDSLSDAIADFVMPRIADPSIFQSARQIELLAHLADDVVPFLDGGDEIRTLAAEVLWSELARHRELQDLQHRGIAT